MSWGRVRVDGWGGVMMAGMVYGCTDVVAVVRLSKRQTGQEGVRHGAAGTSCQASV